MSTLPASGAGERWTFLGSLTLQPDLKQDALDLSKVQGRIKAIRIVARRGSVTLSRISLVQQTGEVTYEERRITLQEGERTRPLPNTYVQSQSSSINVTYADAAVSGVLELDFYALLETEREGRRAIVYGAPYANVNCIDQNTCTPVNVYFGSNREYFVPPAVKPVADGDVPEDAEIIGFTKDRSETMRLGRTIVTVPRAYRKSGEIPRPSWWDLLKFRSPSLDPSRHFAIQGSSTKFYETPEAYVADVKKAMAEPGTAKDHVFIFVHGYNTKFEDALFRAAQISYDLGENDQPFGTAMVFSWPSSGETADYVYDMESASFAVPHLKNFVKLATDNLAPARIHLIAHSMGNVPLLKALEEIAKDPAATPGQTKIETVILAAPDFDAVEFRKSVANVVSSGKTFTLYASANDRALLASKKLRNDLVRAGDVPATGPVIVNGLDSLDISAVSTDLLSLNHSGYADKKELLTDMRRLMLKGTRPPNTRNSAYKIQGEGTGTFWKFIE